MSNKAKEALDAVSKACDSVSKWMYDKEERGEDTDEFDKWGNSMGDIMVDWLERLGEIHDQILEYADKWGDLND